MWEEERGEGRGPRGREAGNVSFYRTMLRVTEIKTRGGREWKLPILTSSQKSGTCLARWSCCLPSFALYV